MNSDNHSNQDWTSQFRQIAELLQQSRDTPAFDDDQKQELNELLRENEANREFAAQYVLDGESLKELLATDEMAALAMGHFAPSVSNRVASPFQRHVFPILAWAATIVIVAGLAFTWSNRAPIALVNDEANAVFADGMAPQDGVFERNTYTLESGMIAVEFRNGVFMTVKAPAEFEIVDNFRVRLKRGYVRAIAPESGHGFVIETPDADIEDLGTEFGVSVDGDSGDSEVHVFDGQVDVKNRRVNDIITSLELGDSARILNGQINPGSTPIPGQFLTPADVSYSRWAQYSAAIRDDEDLVFYYGFKPKGKNDRTLRDEATHGQSVDGKIQGARWVSGRWPGKRALLFDQQGDGVEINIPTELPRFTFAAWVKVDRLDEPLTSILNSMGWKENSMHLQISRSRQSFNPGIFPRVSNRKTDVKVPMGQWALLVAVVDAEARSAKTWINGAFAIDGILRESPTINPGLCLLGEYRTELEGERSRGFRGRMDEVILWKRKLSEPEILQLYEKGRPGSMNRRDS